MFSKACQYSIRATIFIAQSSLNGNRVRLNAIAKGIDSPTAFTAKLLQKLAKAHIIDSAKGPLGGFSISHEKCSNTSLKELVQLVDGNDVFENCPLGLATCTDEAPCPIHRKLKKTKDELRKIFSETFLIDFVKTDKEDIVFFLKRT